MNSDKAEVIVFRRCCSGEGFRRADWEARRVESVGSGGVEAEEDC